MSRTDAHAPLWVRLARGELAAQARHTAAHDCCDLPAHPPRQRPSWRPGTQCYWAFTYTGTRVCSCWMCHAGWNARRTNRRARHRTNAALRAASRQWAGGDEVAFDELTDPTRSRFW